MFTNHAARGGSRPGHRSGLLLLLLPILALTASLSACKNPADPHSPVAPVVGFILRGLVSETPADGESGIGAVLVEITSGEHSGTSTTTTSAGLYSIPGLTGQLSVSFSRDAFVAIGRTVNMDQDTVLNVTLVRQDEPEPPAPAFTLSGFVSERQADGEVIGGIGEVLVEITSGEHSGTSTTSFSSGAYSIPSLTGELNVRYSLDGFVATGRTLNMDQDTVLDVTLVREDEPDPSGPAFTLSGVVSEAQGDGDVIGGAVVEVLDGENAGDAATTDSLGRYSIPALSGELTLRASRDGFAPREATVDMTEDRTLSFGLLLATEVSMCLDLDDEEVHITNDSADKELVLTDWVLREDDEGNAFTFVEDIACRESMSGFTLEPGATVIITSGDDPRHSPPTHIAGWCDFVWDNDGDIARLLNPDGDLIAEAVGSFDSCDGSVQPLAAARLLKSIVRNASR